MTFEATSTAQAQRPIVPSKDLAGLELANLYESIPVGLALLDPNFCYLRVNERLAQMHDLPVRDHLGKHVSEVVPQLMPAMQEAFAQVLRTGSPVLNTVINGRMSLRRQEDGHWAIHLYPLIASEGGVAGIQVVVQDFSDTKPARELAARFKFESLLADLSTQFINMPANEVDLRIEDAQRCVCECLGLDVASLWQWSDDNPGLMRLTHYYRPLGGPPIPSPMYADEYFPWCHRQVMAGRTAVVPSADNAPEEAARDKEVWRHFGIKATLVFPLAVSGGSTFGALSFNDMRQEREWHEELVNRLRQVAQVFANALARKISENWLRDYAERLAVATEGAQAGLWILDLNTEQFWLTAITRELYHFAADEAVSLERFMAALHPDDRELVRGVIRQAIHSEAHRSCEFRAVLPDGEIRWLIARGRVCRGASGKADRLVGVTTDITERKLLETRLQTQLQEITELRKRLELENIYLKEEYHFQQGKHEIVGQSQAIQQVLRQIEQVSATDSHVLITGETGTGKELVARAIHASSKRKDRLMVTINCATLPPTLIESELFGREKGAYTGALIRQIGRFELADKGTIFLDEIGELPIELQGKLLRVLQEGTFERLGGPAKTIRVDVRVIAATNKDLGAAAREGAYRKDLYYRLSVFPIEVPPLRARAEDIPLLTWSFIDDFNKKMGKKIESVPQKAMDLFKSYSWPGNVRELRNVIERAMITSSGSRLDVQLLHEPELDRAAMLTLEEAERRHILSALEKTGWRIKGPQGAATLLAINPSTLNSRMVKLGIPTRQPKNDISH